MKALDAVSFDLACQSVLISIRPKWCDLIKSGEKTVELRRDRPWIAVGNNPFKCFIYETKNGGGCGAVIGEFICDEVEFHGGSSLIIKEDREQATAGSCVSKEELHSWLKIGEGKKDKSIVDYSFYGWHITDLRIYVEPIPLSSFGRVFGGYSFTKFVPLARPPISWCYVTEVTAAY